MNGVKHGTVAVVLICLAGSIWLGGTLGSSVDGGKSTVVFNITSGKEDLQAVTMALQLAGHALDDGREVVLFLNVRAPEFAARQFPDKIAFRTNPPTKTMFADLTKRGARVLVCPHCVEALGMTAANLAEGMHLASRETLFGSLGPNSVVFTY